MAIGALASRAVTVQAARGVAVLVVGVVFTILLGLKNFPVPWIAPPMMSTARDTIGTAGLSTVLVTTGWGLAWSAVSALVYSRIRLHRA